MFVISKIRESDKHVYHEKKRSQLDGAKVAYKMDVMRMIREQVNVPTEYKYVKLMEKAISWDGLGGHTTTLNGITVKVEYHG